VLYLTDIFGNALINNKLLVSTSTATSSITNIHSLADSIAKAGYLVVMPDLFRGEPVPADALSNPALNYSLPEWQQRHPLADIESVIDTTLNSLRTTYNASKIGSVGYCFGGKYVARYLAEGKGIDAGFTAHPSNTQPEEWDAVASPISIAFGDLDQSNTRDNRTSIEDIFFEGNKTYQTSLYSNAEHGFAVRTNLSVPQKAFAQEGAYFLAVRWLDAWVAGQI
jgi:dienelactone hydrolase